MPPWLYFPWSESVKKLSCRYLLQRYLGQFLEEKLSLDQLTVDLYNGIGSVSDVTLDVQALNELGEQYNLPVEFVDGFISEIKVSIPWSSLLNESSSLQVHGLNLVIQPKQRTDSGASMFESTRSSMTSSIQLVEECLKQNPEESEQLHAVNGVEDFAKTIDSILARIKIQFHNTTIRLEHLTRETAKGAAIELRVKQFGYFDETSTEVVDEATAKPTSAYSVKVFSIEGVELYTNEFYASNRTISRSLLIESSLSEDSSEIPDRRKIDHDIVMFGKFIGKHELRMKIKQKENISGPRVDYEMNMSAIVFFLSPRQVRTICEVVCGLMSPHLQDTSNVVSKPRHNQKPMTTSDFERVEHELNQHINPSTNFSNFVSKSLQNTTCWSSGGVEDESDDEFHPVKGHGTGSFTSSVANSVCSSYSSSSASSYQYNSKLNDYYSSSQLSRHHHSKHKEKGVSDADSIGEYNNFQMRLNSLTTILLHEDVLRSADESLVPDDTSVEKLRSMSRTFFDQFAKMHARSFGNNDFKYGKAMLQDMIDRNHFRLYCNTIIVNGDEKSNTTSSETQGTFTVANADFVECLMELKDKKCEIVELIQFIRPETGSNKNSAVFSRPNVTLNFKHSKYLRHFTLPKVTELDVKLEKFRTEIDVTIIDRLSNVINNFNLLSKSFVKPPLTNTNNLDAPFNDVQVASIDHTHKLDWKICSPSILIKLRFPIPDLRTECDEYCPYWYRRNIYSDYLLIDLTDPSIQSLGSPQKPGQSVVVQCKSVEISFKDANCDKPVPFFVSRIDEKSNSSLPNAGKGFGWPRLVLNLRPNIGYMEFEEEEEDNRGEEGAHGGTLFQSVMKKEPSPFTAKMVFRESDTSHPKSTNSNDGEEIVLPGSKEEIEEFVENASHNALIQINVSLPSAIVQIPSKHFYETLYNRINNDLMLWEPTTSKRKSNERGGGYPGQNDFNFNYNSSGSMFTSFSFCKSTMKNHSDSDDEENGADLLINMNAEAESKKTKPVSSHHQSNVTVSVFVARGILDIFPHARDSLGKVIPEQFGEIQYLFDEANLFFVSGYKSDPFLNYVCLRINHMSLYHCHLLPSNTDISIKSADAYPSKHVLPTIYKTCDGGIANENCSPVGTGSANSDDMLTLAIRSQGAENRLKNICVANSLNCVTIRHRMKASYTSWLSQLIDFFDVVDYPILNYQPWKVVTQLHQQFVNCLIDYRPLYLPLKAALFVEYFNISSNITAKTSTSILRLIAEEGSLFLSRATNDNKGDDAENLSIDLKNDYVCVIDMGLFDLSLRLSDSGEGPQTDLRASNNIVHIRTCADSAIALMELAKYIASDGDLCDANAQPEYQQSNSALRGELNEQVLVNLRNDEDEDCPTTGTTASSSRSNSVISEADNDVPYLVEEAMNDTISFNTLPKKRPTGSKRRVQGPVELFYFPDEENAPIATSNECVPSSSSTTNQIFSDSQSSDDDFEAEFCILDAEMGVGYLGKSNVPEVRLLTKEPIRMVDNHFSMPVSKVDVLKAPKSYPQPVSKYTLREMTIVWHMYGGHDFPKLETTNENVDSKKPTSPSGSHPSSTSSQESLNSTKDENRLMKRTSMDSINVTFNALRVTDLHAVNFVMPRSSSRASFAESLQDSPTVLYDKHKSGTWQARGGPNRDHDSLMELKLTKLKYQYEIYPKNTKQACRQVLLVQDVEIGDRMASSQMNKFLYQYSSSTRPKQSNANMVVIKATNIRPEPNVSHLQECCLRVSLLPLRLNIDQDSLQFLVNFFSEISGNSKSSDESSATVSKPTPQPVMNIENINVAESPSMMTSTDSKLSVTVPGSSNSPIFIRSFVFSPEVPIRLDYEGKHVDLSLGPLAGLVMGLGQLNCSELKLKRIFHRQGFLGLEKLVSYVLSEWSQDIRKNQLPSLLSGVGPMHSLVQLVQGIRDLFWLPIEQYQKDGRIVRGLQRGANSFTTSSAVALLEITARLVYAIQRIAETAFDIVSPGPSIKYLRYYDRNDRNDRNRYDRRSRRHYNQPADIREGFATAFQLVKEGIGETAETLVRVASIEHEVKGAVGAVGGVLKEIPSTAIKPIILASQATTNVLDGVRSQLVPDARQEAALKWRTDYF